MKNIELADSFVEFENCAANYGLFPVDSSLVEDSSGSKVFREREFSPASFLFVRVSVSVFEILLEARVLKLRTRKGTNLSCDVDESFCFPSD